MFRCSVCGQGTLVAGEVVDHDISALAGLEHVVLARAPAHVCDHCGAATLSGEVIEGALAALAQAIVERRDDLGPAEVRFLRTELGLTQGRLAERLGVDLAAVALWEDGSEAPSRLQSLALRSFAAWTLIAREPRLAAVLSASFVRDEPVPTAPPYRVELSAA